jgi:hypothetical protein
MGQVTADSGDKGPYDHEHYMHHMHLLRFVAANPHLDELLGLWMARRGPIQINTR